MFDMMMQTQMPDHASHSTRHQFAVGPSHEAAWGRPGSDMAKSPMPLQWLASVLDEIDYGILLVTHRQLVLYSNHTARRELRQDCPLLLDEDHLGARQSSDAATLREAVRCATQRGLRRLVMLNGSGGKPLVVAFVPLSFCHDGEPVALLLLGKRGVCEDLSAQGFARCHGLTPTERDVLVGLCAGHPPRRIASHHGVALATVRAQIASIRSKTGASSIRALLEQVAQLPPLVGTLRN
jgi:DNA-binding CsgD family transcriptional regulator